MSLSLVCDIYSFHLMVKVSLLTAGGLQYVRLKHGSERKTELIFVTEQSRVLDWRPHTPQPLNRNTTDSHGSKKNIMNVWAKEELKIEPVHLLPQLVSLLFSHLSWWIRRLSLAKPPTCWIFTSWARSSRVGLSGADKQLVPAHHPLPHVHFVQPDVGLPYQGLLHELTSVGYQEKLESHRRERERKPLIHPPAPR